VDANAIEVYLPLALAACFRYPVADPALGILAMGDRGW